MALLLVIAGISSCVAIRSRDIPAPNDADLMLKVADVAPDENGYVLLEALIAKLDVPLDNDFEAHLIRVLREGEEPEARVATVLKTNRGVLADVAMVVASPSFQYPERSIQEMHSIRYLLLAKLLAVQAYDHARHGRTGAALQSGVTAIGLGHRVQNAQRAALVDMMIGLSMSNFGAQGLRKALPFLRVSAEGARRAAEALVSYRSNSGGWARVWSFEYQFGKNILASTKLESDANPPVVSWNSLNLLPRAYTFQPNRTQDWLATHYRGYQHDSTLPCARLEAAPQEPSDWQRLRSTLDRNGVASVIFRSISNLRRFHDRRCLADTDLAATATLLGLRAHQVEHHQLAESLDELVPAYLPSLPHDGFDDAPLRYSKTTRRLYCRGSDGIDHGGRDEPSTSLDRDLFAREPTYLIQF
jgi:hypothetical protein